MQTKHSIAWGALAIIGFFCLVMLFIAPGAMADSPYNIDGSSGVTTTFTAQAWSNATVTLTQENGVFRYNSGSSARAWGRYHIDITLNGQTQRLEWEPATGGQTIVLRLNQQGYYTIRVSPWTPVEMRTQISGFNSWNTLPTWAVTGTSNCTLNGGAAPTTTPANTATVTVYYRDSYGATLQTHSVTVRQGANTITAPITLQNGTYSLISQSSQSVTLYSNGTLSATSVTFYYSRSSTVTPTPTPAPVTATISVYYRTTEGSLLQMKTATVSQGVNTITAPATLQGGVYILASQASQSVTLYSNGSLSANSVTFYYSRNNPATPTPTPVPVTATVSVYYRTTEGSLIQMRSITVNQGTNTVTAPSTLQGGVYTLASQASQSVTLYSNGTLSTSSLTFYYSRVNPATPTPTPAPLKKDITVYYRSNDGALLQSYAYTCSVGTNSITAPTTLQNNRYNLISPSVQQVTLYSNGTLSANSVTFYYMPYNPVTPTPTPVTATCTVYYRSSDGTLLQSHTVTCSVGNNTITAPATLWSGDYNLISPNPQTVTVYTNGTMSTNSVTFYYSRREVITPTPAPVTATCMVYYRDINGGLLQSRMVTCTVGNNTITAPTTLQDGDYTLSSPQTQTVTVYSDGSMSTNSVTFYYTEVPAVMATITVQKRDVDSLDILSSTTQTLRAGTHAIQAGSAPSGYRLYSQSTVSVTVYPDGTVSQSTVTFDYKRISPPTPTDPSIPVGPQVHPTSWDTQFKPGTSGSSNENRYINLPNLYDNNINTSFNYIYWSGEVKDDIPELTVLFEGFGGNQISAFGLIAGKVTSSSQFERNSMPTEFMLRIYSDEGVSDRTVSLNRGYSQNMRTYSLGHVYHNVTKIEIFITHIRKGQGDNQYNVHLTELAFFE